MDYLHINPLLYCRKHSLCGLELHERLDWRATAPDTHRSFSDTTLFADTASPCIHCYLVCNYAWQQNSCTLWLHTKHQMTALHLFMTTSSASYTTRCSVFQLIMYTNVKMTKKYYRNSLWVCCQPAKKEHKLEEKKFSVKIKYKLWMAL